MGQSTSLLNRSLGIGLAQGRGHRAESKGQRAEYVQRDPLLGEPATPQRGARGGYKRPIKIMTFVQYIDCDYFKYKCRVNVVFM